MSSGWLALFGDVLLTYSSTWVILSYLPIWVILSCELRKLIDNIISLAFQRSILFFVSGGTNGSSFTVSSDPLIACDAVVGTDGQG